MDESSEGPETTSPRLCGGEGCSWNLRDLCKQWHKCLAGESMLELTRHRKPLRHCGSPWHIQISPVNLSCLDHLPELNWEERKKPVSQRGKRKSSTLWAPHFPVSGVSVSFGECRTGKRVKLSLSCHSCQLCCFPVLFSLLSQAIYLILFLFVCFQKTSNVYVCVYVCANMHACALVFA